MKKTALVAACLFAFAGVALGAMGAHALKGTLGPARIAIFETAVRYQMYHALALFILAAFMKKNDSKLLGYSAALFMAGIFLFSGSLYALSLSEIKIFGAITPIGGFSFLLGWILALIHFIRTPNLYDKI